MKKILFSFLFFLYLQPLTCAVIGTNPLFAMYCNILKPFDFSLEEAQNSEVLSTDSIKFSVYSIFSITQLAVDKQIPCDKILSTCDSIFRFSFIKNVCEFFISHCKPIISETTENHANKNKRKKNQHLETKDASSSEGPKATTPPSNSEPNNPLIPLYEEVYTFFNEQHQKEKASQKTAFEQATQHTPHSGIIDLRFFEPFSNTTPSDTLLKNKSAAREAILFLWRKETKQLNAYLKTHLIGQNNSIDGLVEGIFQHYAKRIKESYCDSMEDIGLLALSKILHEKKEPSSILITGPSGTGKTEMIRLASTFLKKPFGCGSGAQLTPAGYKGDDPADTVKQLLAHSAMLTAEDDRDYEEFAQNHGIILLDEIDKTAVRPGDENFKEGAQHGLLTFIEGSQPINISEDETFDTSNILFILAGAFSDIIPSQQSETKKPVKISRQDLINYGLRPELVNRFRIILQTNPLTKEDLFNILFIPHSVLYKVIRETKDFNQIDIRFHTNTLRNFCEFVEKDGIGARNLYGLLKELIYIAIQSQEEDDTKNNRPLSKQIEITQEHLNKFKTEKQKQLKKIPSSLAGLYL